jgi:ATP synthase protein I
VNSVALFIESKPIRTALRWQLYATAASMSLAAIWMGIHGASSALLGGLTNVTAGTVFGWLATRSVKRTAGEALIAAMRAEAVKVTLIVVQLWLVMALYKQVVPVIFFGTFILTVIFFSLGIISRSK